MVIKKILDISDLTFFNKALTNIEIKNKITNELFASGITFNPTTVETPNTELGLYRLEFITAEEAGEVLDTNDYDWVALNYDTPLVIETCYLNVPPPM